MALTKAPRILIIDGNNLAHYLYPNLERRQKMTAADSLRLVDHMAGYARNWSDSLEIELCLDRSPGDPGLLPGNLRILFAEFPQTGDDLLLGRFWFHQYSRRPCLVITNDEAVREEVGQAGGNSLLVYHFVRRPGLVSPVFLDVQDLPAVIEQPGKDIWPGHALSLSTSIYFRIVEENGTPEEKGQPAARRCSPPTADDRPRLPAARSAEPTKAEGEHLHSEVNGELAGEPFAIQPPTSDDEEIQEEGPYYFLSLDTWPVKEGVRFLLNAFCTQHRVQYHDLMSEFHQDTLRPADLRALAELLLHACGEEDGFARHGSVMARVRLALLQARGEPLTLTELAWRTGLKVTGLRGRIKQKASPWLEILSL